MPLDPQGNWNTIMNNPKEGRCGIIHSWIHHNHDVWGHGLSCLPVWMPGILWLVGWPDFHTLVNMKFLGHGQPVLNVLLISLGVLLHQHPPTSLEAWLLHLHDALQEWQDLYPKKPTKERGKELLSEQPVDETVVASAPAKTSAVDS